MQTYIVGGAVRDELLGRPNADHDYVVVGTTPEAMLAQGFRPVGKDFPVFLHPRTQDEYALARTERKSGHGYHGFAFHAAPDVTLEEDLARRDLTINAMARAGDGSLIDPFGGQRDLQAKLLRHVSPAFAEDPVRILRIARFAARFADFSIAPETLELMREMVSNGEVDHLVAERVWQELAKGLSEDKPSRMFEVLRECGALARLLPEVEALFGVPQRADYHPEIDTGIHTMMVIDQSARRKYALPVRFAALTHDLGKAETPPDILPRHIGHEERSVKLVEQVCLRLRVPNDCRDLALMTARYHGNIHRAADLRPSTVVTLLEKTDALRRPDRFQQLLDACRSDYTGRLGWEDRAYDSPQRLLTALAAVNAVEAGKIAAACADKAKIPERIHAARVNAVKLALDDARD
jgi:tRNA nucleotidyltransferase (CCA-adding enzyme)